jgi:ribose transport system ATP-binding protein
MENYLLQMKGICKEFAGVKALRGVDFNLKPGEIHALIGMNGSGKSTLIKILAGIYQKDAGEVFINGNKVEINNPASAKELGIATVYQDPQTISSFTGYENIYLGSETEKKSVFQSINRVDLRKRAQKLLEKYPFRIDLNKPVYELEAVEKETIAVLRALSQENTCILVLDEPTSILTRREIDVLFKQIKILKDSGISIIYITHRLDEIFQVADSFTIFRDGTNVGTYDVKESGIDHSKITELMLGKKVNQVYPERNVTVGEEYLRLEDLTQLGYFQNINLSVKKGQIVGVFGLVSSGFDELCKTIFGLTPPTSGKMHVKGKQVRFNTVTEAIRQGVFLIPGDRRAQGQISDETVTFNLTLSALDKISMLLGMVNKARERDISGKIVDQLQIKTPSIEQKVGLLSGGNQQKVVIGKGLGTDSEVYIFEEPTVGVDVGAKASIYHLIRELSKEKAVVVVSSDCEEVFGICDEAVVMYKGKMVLHKPVEETRLDEMLLYGMTGGPSGGKNGK